MALIRFQTAPAPKTAGDFRNFSFHDSMLTQPMVNIVETEDGFRIDLAAPGLGKDDFQLKIEKDLLTISGSKAVAKPEDGARYHRQEFAFGTFERAFRLPETIDTEKVKATFTNGILHVRLQRKAELQPVVKAIPVG